MALEARFARVLAAKPRIILGTGSSSRRAVMDQLAQTFSFSYDVRKADIDEKAIRDADPSELVMALAHAKADAVVGALRREGPCAAAQPAVPVAAAAGVGAGAPAGRCGGAGGSGQPSTSGTSSAAAQQQQQQQSPWFLITCDQVVVHEGRILEKPEDASEARAFIAGYARSPAQTVGSVLCTRLRPSTCAAAGSRPGGGGFALEEEARVGALERCTILMDPLPAATVNALIAEGDVLWCAGGLMVEHALVRPHVRGIEGGREDSVMGLGREAVMRVIVDASEADDGTGLAARGGGAAAARGGAGP